jgi:hypothetical protein
MWVGTAYGLLPRGVWGMERPRIKPIGTGFVGSTVIKHTYPGRRGR